MRLAARSARRSFVRAHSRSLGSSSSDTVSTLKIPRVFNDSLGDTHFDDIYVLMKDKEGKGAAGIGKLSDAVPASKVMFRHTPGDYLFDWHQAPQEQFIVNLDADVHITVTDGSTRVLKAGEVFYVEDTSGTGHKSQAVDGKDRHSVFVPCAKDTLLPKLVPAPTQYGKIDLRVGVIRSVENHPDADALYVESIDVGESEGPRQIISGLVPFFPAEALVDRKVVVMCNLPKSKLRGVASNGMILCASAPGDAEAASDPIVNGVGHNADKNVTVAFVEPPEGAQPGDRVTVDNRLNDTLYGAPLSANQMKKQKKIVPEFLEVCRTAERSYTDPSRPATGVDRFVATVDGIPLVTPAGPCTVAALGGANIH